ncbi:MAG: hypothetical protein IKI90_01210 [Treponema sp.]|nr:hypothetical protein [Treponema sp.]
MRRHPIRKFVGLTVLYAALIVGIFVLQFKTESVINRVFGDLRISLAQTQGDQNLMKLKNQFQVSYRGLNLVAGEGSPVKGFNSASPDAVMDLVLDNFTETKNSLQLNFAGGSSITFTVSDEAPGGALHIYASAGSGLDTISVPYRNAPTHTVEELSAGRVILNSKEALLALTAAEVDSERIYFTVDNPLASYAVYDPSRKFEFVAVAGMPMTDVQSYNTSIKQFRDTLVTRFTQTAGGSQAEDLSEKDVVAFVAEMASRNQYNEGLDLVPDSFKRSNRRTYVSAPYFDNLVNMDKTLSLELERFNSMVQTAINSGNLDIYTVDGICDYMLREKNSGSVLSILGLLGSLEETEPTVTQAIGILSVYGNMLSKDKEISARLMPALPYCISVLEDNAVLENGVLHITENDLFISVEQNAILGTALILIGSQTGHNEYVEAGRLLVNQQLAYVSSMNLSALSALYPLILPTNTYYPHTLVLGYYSSTPVWTWTCANNVTYKPASDGVVSLNIEFPLENTHYLIVRGVPTFHSKIEIQQMMFRTDPKFEGYNSSGYVYSESDKTLFLKSRHKSKSELIRLWCDPVNNFVQKN